MSDMSTGFGKLFHDEPNTMDDPAHTRYEIEQYQARIADLESKIFELRRELGRALADLHKCESCRDRLLSER